MILGTWLRRLVAVCMISGLAACASAPEGEGFAAQDPYEGTNRNIHAFNVALDKNVLRPAAKAYDVVAYGPIQLVLGNGLNHLDLPVDFVNYLLQGEMRMAGRVLGRFTVNTVMGAGGLLDPATELGLPREETDFGITLGKYGVGGGPFLMLPLLGPSNPRDLAGFVVDTAFRPTTYLTFANSAQISNVVGPSLTAVDRVDTRNANADLIDEILYEAPDSYVTLRSFYLQRREAQITGGTDEALPDIFDEE
ncbi:MAG: VacJ family lipoprotein [Pseudomonadota bacterium]